MFSNLLCHRYKLAIELRSIQSTTSVVTAPAGIPIHLVIRKEIDQSGANQTKNLAFNVSSTVATRWKSAKSSTPAEPASKQSKVVAQNLMERKTKSSVQ
jgi:hypothetical protein